MISFKYHFYPVGQGLFSTGSICLRAYDAPKFLWVYDCGTVSDQMYVVNAVERLKSYAGNRSKIDLLILSHFDRDHISGVVRLISELAVGTLVLPYMPLAQRLEIAFKDHSYSPSDPFTDFCINPVRYLLSQEQSDLGRILLIPYSGVEGPSYPEESPNPTEPAPDDELNIQYVPDDVEDSNDRSALSNKGSSSVAVDYLKPGTSMVLPAVLWEFVPYNVDNPRSMNAKFLKLVEDKRDSLLRSGTVEDRINALNALKDAYDCNFGARSSRRNAISLFFYSGPIYSKNRILPICLNGRLRSRVDNWNQRLHKYPCWHQGRIDDLGDTSQSSILYTGDGYLNNPKRLEQLATYFGVTRLDRVGVFQVMHHGAKGNWHAGVAAAIAPLYSVFSSDPASGYQHPHANVLREFWRYGAVQVDTHNEFTARGLIIK